LPEDPVPVAEGRPASAESARNPAPVASAKVVQAKAEMAPPAPPPPAQSFATTNDPAPLAPPGTLPLPIVASQAAQAGMAERTTTGRGPALAPPPPPAEELGPAPGPVGVRSEAERRPHEAGMEPAPRHSSTATLPLDARPPSPPGPPSEPLSRSSR